MENHTIAIFADKDNPDRHQLKKNLIEHQYRVVEAYDQAASEQLWQAQEPDVITICLEPETTTCNSLNLVEQIRNRNHIIPLIIITRKSSETLAIAALKLGVNDYFTCPINFHGLLDSIKKILANSDNIAVNSYKPKVMQSPDHVLVGNSFAMQGVRNFIPKIANTDSNVLITGETGTGKECAARQIHYQSPRSNKTIVCLNCAALPDNLLESELFGFEKGAFTGANSTYSGKLMQADGGSVFFDEIGDMSLFAQAKILRVLEDKEVTPLRSKRHSVVDIRIIAATNQNLEQLVADKKFREDLYYRLNVMPLRLPPLRERKEDIPQLIEHFLQKLKIRSKSNILGFSDQALQCLLNYNWPGNIRELKNLLEALSIVYSSQYIKVQELPKHINQFLSLDNQLLDEKELLFSTLLSTNWNKSKTAEKLHWSRMTVYRKIEKYHIVPCP